MLTSRGQRKKKCIDNLRKFVGVLKRKNQAVKEDFS